MFNKSNISQKGYVVMFNKSNISLKDSRNFAQRRQNVSKEV